MNNRISIALTRVIDSTKRWMLQLNGKNRLFMKMSAERRLRLNLGSGKAKLLDWINIDLIPSADLVWDIRRGLPFKTGTVDLIYNEHFLEHLTYDQAGSFLKECWRCLKDDGVLRIATPDLDHVIRKYCSDWKNQDWLTWPEYQFISTRGMMLNVSFRWWGHQHLYNEEDLRTCLIRASFKNVIRCEWNQSTRLELKGLETRKDSVLIVEASKN
jgi:predicted SAM-dependent methyltransferase